MDGMGKVYERIDGRLRTFIEAQPLFFTATAPLSGDGTVNLSPKGLDRVVRGARRADRGLSRLRRQQRRDRRAPARERSDHRSCGAPSSGPPNIVRVHGRGEPVFRDDPRFAGAARPLRGHRRRPRTACARSSSCAPKLIRTPAASRCPSWTYDEDRDAARASASRAEDDASLERVLREEGTHRDQPGRTARAAAAAAADPDGMTAGITDRT